jgi:acetyltransferase-like isoleucine patch superfamily enzyme
VSLRRGLKGAVVAGCALLLAPAIVLAWLERRAGDGGFVFRLGSEGLALVPGAPGAWLRAAWYAATLEQAHWEIHVGFGSVFTKRGARVAARASLGAYCVIGHAVLGEAVMIGSRVSIPSGKRQHFDDDGRLSQEAGRFDTVRIGTGTWVGEGAIVVADVGEQCVIAAGAVVTRPIPERSLAAGNPAQVVRAVEA